MLNKLFQLLSFGCQSNPTLIIKLLTLSASLMLVGEMKAQENLALGGTAIQTTDYAPQFGASVAIDGNPGNFTATAAADEAPVWEVDLGDFYEIGRIVVHNRDNCCPSRLRDIVISIHEDSYVVDPLSEPLYESEILNAENVLGNGALNQGPETLTITLDPPVDGQYVRVSRIVDPDNSGVGGQGSPDEASVLSLGEVEVFEPVTCPEPDTFCNDLGIVGPGVGLPGVYTITANASDDSGDEIQYTFEISNGEDPATILGPQTANFVEVALGQGSWEVSVAVTDNNLCPNAAEESCTELIEITCSEGDTHCEGLAIQGPANEGPGTYILSTTASDDSGDDIFYTYTIDDGVNPLRTIGPTLEAEVEAVLRPGSYTVTVEVADSEFCENDVPDRSCTETVEVESILSLASTGIASQSSDYNAGLVAGLAIDGLFTNTTATAQNNNGLGDPWWQVDLLGLASIETILLFNRGDGCCQSRLRDMFISILDQEGEIVWESELLNEENELGGGTTAGPGVLEIDVVADAGGAVEGQVIRITRIIDDDLSGTGGLGNLDEGSVISLGEVLVYGERVCEDDADTHCDSLVLEEAPEDEGPGQYSFTATGSDDSGDEILYTFTADNGIDEPMTFGPLADNLAIMNLTAGDWTVSVNASDEANCPSGAEDAACTLQVSVKELVNLSTLSTVRQSSTFGGVQFPAELAIDGNFGNFTATETGNEGLGDPWWEADLGAELEIGRVEIYNRGDGCCQSRLRDIQVDVFDAANEVVWQSEILNEENELGGGTTDGPAVLTLYLDGVVGQVVRITRLADPDLSGTGGVGGPDEMDILSLGEVNIFEHESVILPGAFFRRGDVDGNGLLEITDPINNLSFQFLGTFTPPCLDAADFDDNGKVEITDPIASLSHQFLGTTAPAPPGSENCGLDPTDDDEATGDLGCEIVPDNC